MLLIHEIFSRPLRLSFFAALMLGIIFCNGKPARALEDFRVYRGVLVVEGKIEKGDYEKFRRFLANKANFDKINNGVFLASPGGNVIEAIKMGRLIRTLRLSTDAPSGPPTAAPKYGQSLITPAVLSNPRLDYQCSSACFFIYVAGVYRNLNWVGRLGLHRPIQLESNAKKLDVEQTLDITWQVRTLIQKYLVAMNVPDKYVDLMYSVPPNEVHWITQTEFDEIGGFVPDVKAWLGNKCSRAKESIGEMKSCWMQHRTELANEAWTKEFGK